MANLRLVGVHEHVCFDAEVQKGPIFEGEVAVLRLICASITTGLPVSLPLRPLGKELLPVCPFLGEPSYGKISTVNCCNAVVGAAVVEH